MNYTSRLYTVIDQVPYEESQISVYKMEAPPTAQLNPYGPGADEKYVQFGEPIYQDLKSLRWFR
jgi:hypothetical protein